MSDFIRNFIQNFKESPQVIQILFFVLLLCSAFFAFSVVLYLKNYKIFSIMFAKMQNNLAKYNALKRAQVQEKYLRQEQKMQFTRAKKEKRAFLTNIYDIISQVGILNYLPGFNESQVLILISVLGVVLCILGTINIGILTGIIMAVVYFVSLYIISVFLIYEKKEQLEMQLPEFINACEEASSVHADIIDIFGDIYPMIGNPIGHYLEDCYIEAKTTNNKQLALAHMLKKTKSSQFITVIQNLELCSASTGNYRKVIDDIREPIRAYHSFKKEKKALVRNIRIRLLTLFCIGVVILYVSSGLFSSLSTVLFHSTIGTVFISAIFIILILGATIQGKEE